jgi:hypothetical protein
MRGLQLADHRLFVTVCHGPTGWPATGNWLPFRRRPPGGCGPWRRLARSAGSWYTAISCTATCWSVRMPAGSKLCCPGSARCAATSSSMPPGAASGRRSTRRSPRRPAVRTAPGPERARRARRPSRRRRPPPLLRAAHRLHPSGVERVDREPGCSRRYSPASRRGPRARSPALDRRLKAAWKPAAVWGPGGNRTASDGRAACITIV